MSHNSWIYLINSTSTPREERETVKRGNKIQPILQISFTKEPVHRLLSSLTPHLPSVWIFPRPDYIPRFYLSSVGIWKKCKTRPWGAGVRVCVCIYFIARTYACVYVCCRLRVPGAVERPLVSIGQRGTGDGERVHDDQQGPLHRDQRRQVPHSGHVSLSFIWIASEI